MLVLIDHQYHRGPVSDQQSKTIDDHKNKKLACVSEATILGWSSVNVIMHHVIT